MSSVPSKMNGEAIPGDEGALRAPDPEVEKEYVRRCLAVEFHDDEEVRTFRSEPDFSRVLEPLNSSEFDKAIREGNDLALKYPDFDLIFRWLAIAYRQNGQLDEAERVLLRGLATSKRKVLLLTELGDTEWQRHDVDSALYWLAQAIHCANPVGYMAYLLTSYIARGRGFEEAADTLTARADTLTTDPLRLSPELEARLMDEASRGHAFGMAMVIQGLSSSLT